MEKGSIVQLTSEGNFVLNDQRGEKVWPADSSFTGVAYAAMLDSGNFVLAGQDSINLWESFDNTTDNITHTYTKSKQQACRSFIRNELLKWKIHVHATA